MSNVLTTPREQGLDRARIARWAVQILDCELEAIEAAFQEAGSRGPHIMWSPRPGAMVTPQLEFLLEYWSGLAKGGEPPPMSRIDPVEMRPALGHLILVDVAEGGADYRYRLYGSAIASTTGFDLTGKSVHAHPAPPTTVEFFIATYEAVRLKRKPLYSAYGPRSSRVMARNWQRLTLPLLGERGEVSRFLVGTLPVSGTGEVISRRL